MKLIVTRMLAVVMLLSNSACRAEETAVVARRDFILGGPHGWVDLVLIPAASPVAGKDCAVFLVMGKEKLFDTFVSMPGTDSTTPVGFRVPVPVGQLAIELTLGGCVEKDLSVKAPVTMAQDQLARLEFDGTQLRVASTTSFDPATLDRVSTDIGRLHNANTDAAQAIAELKSFAKGSLWLNGLLVLAVLGGLLVRRRKSGPA